MKCLCQLKSACHRIGRIHLVDKCLLVILALLMTQSALNLFLHEQMSAETNGIDVVVRTSSASIFGYLVSINFNQHRKRSANKTTQSSAPTKISGGVGGVPTAQIGFQAQGGGEGGPAVPRPPTLAEEDIKAAERRSDRAQILVVASVGIISLVILLIFRNFIDPVAANAGSVTQFRDFVSGSVGFLIGCSTSGVENEK